jgi:hypothetical protein
MASRASKIAAVAREIFGTLPIRGVRTGLQFLKKPLTGAYEARYYMEPIEPFARKVRAITYLFCLCDRTGCLGEQWPGDLLHVHDFALPSSVRPIFIISALCCFAI